MVQSLKDLGIKRSCMSHKLGPTSKLDEKQGINPY